MAEETKNSVNLNNLIALFLAEAIRTKRTSLSRAAEISSHVIAKMKNLKSEEEALLVLTNLEKDFEEVSSIKQALHFGGETSDIKIYEAQIKDYASKIIAKDIGSSNSFLQDAAGPEMTIQKLCVKYPDFCRFLISTTSREQAASLELPITLRA
jgi:hypothetical protein